LTGMSRTELRDRCEYNDGQFAASVFHMQNTPTELYRDAIGMIAADKLPHSAIKQANLLAETGEAFNAAVWAAIRLQEMVRHQ